MKASTFLCKKSYHQNIEVPLQFYLELSWENELDISKYLLDVEQFSSEWVEAYPKMKNLITQLDPDLLKTIFATTRRFIINVFCEMKKSLPFNDSILKASLVVFMRFETFYKEDWQTLRNKFTNIISDDENRHFQGELKRM